MPRCPLALERTHRYRAADGANIAARPLGYTSPAKARGCRGGVMDCCPVDALCTINLIIGPAQECPVFF